MDYRPELRNNTYLMLDINPNPYMIVKYLLDEVNNTNYYETTTLGLYELQ